MKILRTKSGPLDPQLCVEVSGYRRKNDRGTAGFYQERFAAAFTCRMQKYVPKLFYVERMRI